MEMSQAALSAMSYNGLSLAAQKSADSKQWQINVDAKDLSWTPAPGGTQVAEVTAMAVAFDDRGNGGGAKSHAGAKSRMLGHVSRELQSERKADSVAGAATFQLPVDIPAGTTRMRFILRDAVSGKIGTLDANP
jgi:hypothetical protein